MEKTIKITCTTGQLLPIDQLERFQGNLKTINDEQLAKLKDSIVQYGFSFPIFVWGKKILDGHQRLKAITSLISDGYEIEDYSLPVVQIQADSEQEAAEKLLLINSRYANMTQDGFDDFIIDFDIDIIEMRSLIEIPEIDYDNKLFDDEIVIDDVEYGEDEEAKDKITITFYNKYKDDIKKYLSELANKYDGTKIYF